MNLDFTGVQGVIGSAEKKHNLPTGTLSKIAGIESNFKADAVSPKGARGWFQFMPETAKQYGVADPTNLEQSADGAGRFMTDLLKMHNGNMDHALAYYNGGGKAVEALKQGKPWKETADYLTKFNGRQFVPTDPLFTTGTNPQVTQGKSDIVMQKEQRISDENFSWTKSIADGFRQDNHAYALLNSQYFNDVADPNMEYSTDKAKDLLADVPKDHWDYILDGTSDVSRAERKTRVMKALDIENEFSKHGGRGFAARLPGQLLDIDMLLNLVPVVGSGTVLLSKASRIANMARTGLLAAGTNAGMEALTYRHRPLGTPSDIYAAAATGLAIGAPLGGLINPASVRGMPNPIPKRLLAEEMNRIAEKATQDQKYLQLMDLIDEGIDLTPKGKLYLKGIDDGNPRQEVFDMAKKAWDELAAKYGLTSKFEMDPTAGGNLIPKGQRVTTDPTGKPIEVYAREGSDAKSGVEAVMDKIVKDINSPTKVGIDDFFTFDEKGKILGMKKVPGHSTIDKDSLDTLGVKTKADVEKVLKDGGVLAKPNTTTAKILDEIITSKDVGYHKTLVEFAKRLRSVMRQDIDTLVTDSAGFVPRGVAGFYNRIGHRIVVKASADKWVHLHEIAHALTVNKLDYGKKNPGTELGRMYKDVNDVYKLALKEAKKQNLDSESTYYLKNIYEFTAGLYSGHPPFIKFLNDVKVKDKSAFNVLVSTIARMLGFKPGEESLFTRALGITDEIMDNRLNVDFKSGSSEDIYVHLSPEFDNADLKAAQAAGLNEVYGIGLGLENILGGKSVPQAVRNLAAKLFGTTVGYRDHSVVKTSAYDDTVKWADGWTVSLRKDANIAFLDWFKNNPNYKLWQRSKAWEDFGEQVSDYVRGATKIDGEFAPQVIKAGNAVRKVLNTAREYINNPLKDEGGTKQGLTQREYLDGDQVKLTDPLEENINYLPRKHDANKWSQLISTYGIDAIEGWWARSYKKARPEVTDEAAGKWAKSYVSVVNESHGNRNQDLLENMMRGNDLEGLKASLIRNKNFSSAEADQIIKDLFPARENDSGTPMSSLKHRNTIDENYTEDWKMPNGESINIGIKDFVHGNAFDLVEPYLRRTAGTVALAKHLDVYKMGDIDKLIADATPNNLGADKIADHLNAKYRNNLQFTFDRLMGLPQEDFSPLNKSLEMWRSFNVIRLMGGAVFNQFMEFGQVVGSMGWKTALSSIPELRKLSRDMTTGKVDNEILNHLENTIGGAGSELIARMDFKASDDWVRHKGDSKYNQWLDKVDNGLRSFSSGILKYTGMTPLMVQQKRVHSVALVNHFVNIANGKPVARFLNKERLAWMGLDEAAYQQVLNNLKQYSTTKKGMFQDVTDKLNFEKWSKEDPENYSKFLTAIHRESRRVIQENDLASMVPIMGKSIAQTMFQFQNFTFQAWNKQMMFAANHQDMATVSTIMHSGILGTLAYMGRTNLQAAGMDGDQRKDFLEKRMNNKQIIANGFGRVAQASMVPQLFDIISPYPMFSGLRTTSDVSSLASNPTISAINSLVSMKKIIKNGLSDESQTTRADARAWGRLLPLNNVVPISTILNRMTNKLPTTETQ